MLVQWNPFIRINRNKFLFHSAQKIPIEAMENAFFDTLKQQDIQRSFGKEPKNQRIPLHSPEKDH